MDWQKIAECQWRIIDEDCLEIAPINGRSGLLKCEVDGWPWEKESIKKIKIYPGVVASGSLEYWFSCYKNLISVELSELDTSNVTNMEWMFFDCTSLTTLDLSSLDTSNVVTMESMFRCCESLTSLDLSGWDTSNVTNMSEMFNKCISLTSLDLSGFDTSKVTNMENMFWECESLTFLDVSSFDTSNRRMKGINGSNIPDDSWIFCDCPKLRTIIVGENFTEPHHLSRHLKKRLHYIKTSDNNARVTSSSTSKNKSSDPKETKKENIQTTSSDEHVQSAPVPSKPTQSESVHRTTYAQSSTNAGVVVAWIGIVLCWIGIGIFAIGIIGGVVLLLMDCYSSGGEYAYYLGITLVYVLTAIAPVLCLVCINYFRKMAKQGKWTSGACVAAVIVALIVAFIVASIIMYVFGVLLADSLSVWLADSEAGQYIARLAYDIVNFAGQYELGGAGAVIIGGLIGVVITGLAIFLVCVAALFLDAHFVRINRCEK